MATRVLLSLTLRRIRVVSCYKNKVQNTVSSLYVAFPILVFHSLYVVVPKNRIPPPPVHSETVNTKNTPQYTVTERNMAEALPLHGVARTYI
jgi:hypothetical protein